jgi:hypothetical protein
MNTPVSPPQYYSASLIPCLDSRLSSASTLVAMYAWHGDEMSNHLPLLPGSLDLRAEAIELRVHITRPTFITLGGMNILSALQDVLFLQHRQR